MKRTLAIGAMTALVLAGCRAAPEAKAMAGMTGAAAGGADTAAKRQPVHLSAVQAQMLGVTYAVVQRGPLERMVRTVGQITPAESRLSEVTTKIDGYVDRLYVDETGEAVRKGEPLLTLYSPMLVAAQEELLTAARLTASVDSGVPEAWRNAQDLLQAARRRLAYWDITTGQIERLERTGQVTKTLTLVAPFDGVVLEKMVVQGQAVMPGMKLYRLADLSTVWVEGEVFEQDLPLVRVGAAARLELAAFPGRSFAARVSFVWPVVDEQSRAGRIRVAVPNPRGELKPGMFATMFLAAPLGADALSVPADAVVMTGERNLVFVAGADGMLQPREVVVGARAGDRLQVLAGLREGERIVTSANFLIDAESRLGGGGAGMAGMPGMDMAAPKEQP